MRKKQSEDIQEACSVFTANEKVNRHRERETEEKKKKGAGLAGRDGETAKLNLRLFCKISQLLQFI